MTILGKLRKSVMGRLPKERPTFGQGNTRGSQHLRNIFATVVRCYHATLEDSRLEVLAPRLNAVEAELRGFAYEGAALGCMVLDHVLPWKKRLLALLAGPASPYVYPAYMGAGLALARLGRQPEQLRAQLDPILGWMVMDGYGFRYGIFSRRLSIEEQAIPALLSGYARRAFDHGLGRSLWFSTGADAHSVAATLGTFPVARHADLWSGVGFACSYAGGADRAAIEALQTAAGSYGPQLAMGAAVGAKGRQRGGNLAPHTDLACEILCGTSSDVAAHMTDVALQNLPTDGVEPAYEIWRQRIQAQFAVLTEREVSGEPHFVH